MTKLTEFHNTTNLIYGTIAAIGAALLGRYWFLFLGFLVANIIDYTTGFIKAKYYLKNESSAVGAKGIYSSMLRALIPRDLLLKKTFYTRKSPYQRLSYCIHFESKRFLLHYRY
ncbi:phage holin family protein [Lachnotalea glycerini]|uniref:Uncharacterized protein n=1 Tax=Lachnotalea glycerini TaxID=1763509 RepID=A0A371JCI1_9FIRM|nr:hypothetical protein CG710_014970 [Lachnotalea glycerini]